MKKVVYLTTLALFVLNTKGMANTLEDLGEIKIVDESAKSNLFQREKIVGCTDFVKKKELSCAKEPKDAILSQLPTSQQLERTDLEDDDERRNMKKKLSDILAELNKLKKEQQASLATIEQLQGIISVLSKEKSINSPQQMTMVKKKIKTMVPKKNKSHTATLIRKKIKEISRDENSVIVEVQNNESLSTYAQAYYNDNSKYHKIYKANKHIIPESMMIVIGDRLTIPLP
ncbi:MAG: Unknown protein [uncultured Sulfurovum sp.]|uniref:LysM domain-containing protein n=1 Tax=uncultured Sulfurovum sp. TaxID=269237 RepID=A0A6S6SG30_9BACT|nr:MAG: Unknown protein [uncultured Sulfurovum sp.]